jgi:hypothetical protein
MAAKYTEGYLHYLQQFLQPDELKDFTMAQELGWVDLGRHWWFFIVTLQRNIENDAPSSGKILFTGSLLKRLGDFSKSWFQAQVHTSLYLLSLTHMSLQSEVHMSPKMKLHPYTVQVRC